MSTGISFLGYNMFAYCNNNPVMFVDYSGNCNGYPNDQNLDSPNSGVPWGIMCGNYGYHVRHKRSADVLTCTTPRDVTKEVNEVLYPTAAQCFRDRILGPVLYIKFYTMVNHEAAWDIKEEKSWVGTIGTPYPGKDVPIIYEGITMTAEGLGNYIYGYLGASFGIPLLTLYGGSYYAAGFPIDNYYLRNEFEDWDYITLGYISAKWEGAFVWNIL